MDTNVIEAGTSLRIARRYEAPRRLVFEALTEPEMLAKWFAPTDEFSVHVDRFEAVVGSAYRIEMRHKDGDVHTCIGKIQEVKPHERLAYTWSWEGGEMGDTLVTWELSERDGGTELVLTHDRFPNEEATAQHTKGWTSMFGRLEGILSS